MIVFSDIWIPLLPLIGVVVGWGLTEWTSSRSSKRDRRKPFGRALTHLLYVHQQLVFLEFFRRLGEKSDSELAKKMMRDAKLNLHSVATTAVEYEQKFYDAVDQISEISPLLAFDLRQKILAREIYKGIRSALGDVSEPGDKVAEIYGDVILQQALPAFEEVLLEVAKHFGREEHHQLGHHFQELKQRLGKLQGLANEH